MRPGSTESMVPSIRPTEAIPTRTEASRLSARAWRRWSRMRSGSRPASKSSRGGGVQPAEVQVEPPGSAVPDLHGRYVSIVDQCGMPQVLGGRRPPVDLDPNRCATHDSTVTTGTRPRLDPPELHPRRRCTRSQARSLVAAIAFHPQPTVSTGRLVDRRRPFRPDHPAHRAVASPDGMLVVAGLHPTGCGSRLYGCELRDAYSREHSAPVNQAPEFRCMFSWGNPASGDPPTEQRQLAIRLRARRW